MRTSSKISVTRQLMRKLVTAITPPRAAWIDAEQGIAFSVTVSPRVRDALVLRPVGEKKLGRGRSASDANGAR